MNSGRNAVMAFLAVSLMAGCASTGEVDDGKELSMACPKDMKLQCFKRTARKEDCYCVNPEDARELLDRIGPKGVLETRRDRDGWD